jgi:hypothetical protein
MACLVAARCSGNAPWTDITPTFIGLLTPHLLKETFAGMPIDPLSSPDRSKNQTIVLIDH